MAGMLGGQDIEKPGEIYTKEDTGKLKNCDNRVGETAGDGIVGEPGQPLRGIGQSRVARA